MLIEKLFPNLKATGYRLTSMQSDVYNCVAWAAKNNERWWEPLPGYYWPVEADDFTSVKTAVKMFESLGFKVCKSEVLEAGYEKVAVYGQDGEYTHAARQLPNGKWTSKLGGLEDIEHDALEGLVGQEYGLVVKVLRKSAK